MDEVVKTIFPNPRQRLPEGWDVVWFEGTEHYHIRYPSGEISDYMSVDRWDARREALREISMESSNSEVGAVSENQAAMSRQDIKEMVDNCEDALDLRIIAQYLRNKAYTLGYIVASNRLVDAANMLGANYVDEEQSRRYPMMPEECDDVEEGD